MEDLRITFIQTALYWENPAANRKMFEKLFDSITVQSDIIILPEMFTTGFTMNAASGAEAMNGETAQWMCRWAAKKNCVVTGSMIIRGNGKYFNRLLWTKPDGDVETYNKRHLFRLPGEEKVYSSGERKLITKIKGWKICPLICYDLRFPVWSRRTEKEDYDVLLYVANWPNRRINAWRQMLPVRAIENQSYVIGVNRIGTDGNGVEHTGESAVYDFTGEKLSGSATAAEMTETVTLSYEALASFRKSYPFYLDADRFELKK
jgi:omega-amidase